MLGDGDHPDALAPEHGLEGDGMLALSGEAGELPDQNLLERSVGLAGRVDHHAELGTVGDAPALGLVHVLADYDVSVLLCMVPECPQLCGDGQVHVLAVAGNPGVEGRRRVVMSFNHLFLPLVSSSWVWRERHRHGNIPHPRWRTVSSFPKHFHFGNGQSVTKNDIPDDQDQGFRRFLEFAQGMIS